MFFIVLISVLILQNSESKQLVGPREVTGLVDGSVTITCPYSTVTKANKYERKFFCREIGRKSCSTIISTNNFVADDFVDRASLVDNKEEGIITVTLSKLKKSDNGIYRCGLGTISNGLNAVMKLEIIEDSVIPEQAELLYGQLRSTVIFSCEFDETYSEMKKYLCKNGKEGCTNVIDSTGKVASDYKGRVILSSGTNPKSFSAKLIQLKREDAGLYSCGVGNYGEDGDFKVFDVRINEETDVPQGSRLLTANLGGSISAQCNYNPKKNYALKFWCKWEETTCDPLIKTDGTVKDTYEGKIIIHDNPKNGSMQVLMNQLTKDDEGWYWCVMTDGKHDQTSTIQVKISEDKPEGLSGNTVFSVVAGNPARISCSYSCKYYSYQKYWCKWSNFGCVPIASVDDPTNGLSVNCENRELILSIDAVKKEDEGWYWCGVKRSEIYGETLAVHLIVTEENIINDPSLINSGEDGGVKPKSENPGPPQVKTDTSSATNNSSTGLAIGLSVCAVVLVVVAIFLTMKLMKRRNSELVSVGSYRTNISLTDMDNTSYIGKDNPTVVESQETDIGRNNESPKSNKKGSREDLDYSTFLIHHDGKPNENISS
ncbi:polymeric immunoglobulin receptor-like [Pelobates fuscus]|uniref:polymeric immunoglobulin receptor-like n=1 Tax=Pelobates fuscus TaxID=191477 RepID=UPI002FE4F646